MIWRVPGRHGIAREGSWLWLAIACSQAPAAQPPLPKPAAQPLFRAELSEYVPAAGLRWLVSGSPRYFARAPALEAVRAEWLTPDRLQAFARATGIDLARTERALIAGYDLGTLYLVDGSAWTQPPEQPFIEHLAGSARLHREGQLLRVSGLAGSTPEVLVRVEDHLVAVSVQDPLLARLVELRALGELGNVVPALRGAALSALPPELLAPGPLRLYAPGPFSDTPMPDRVGLIAAAEAIAAALAIEGDVLELRIALGGTWLESTDRERLLDVWRAVASSALGTALGLERPRAALSVQVSPRLLQLHAKLDAARFFEGLRQLAASDVDRLRAEPAPAQQPVTAP